MTLPRVDVPTYELKIPSSSREITVRPFLVKEEKLLLIAAESKDDKEIITTTKQVIKNCIVSDDIDVDSLPFFDIDYLFIALRAKSIGESIEMRFTCNNVLEDGNECGHMFYADIDIAKAKIEEVPGVERDIRLSDKMTVRMKYPSYAIMKVIDETENVMEKKIKVIMNCIEYIVDGEAVYSVKDYTKDELKDFIEGLTEKQFKSLEVFVDNFPSFAVDLDMTCQKCKFDHHLKYKDFTSFFL